MKELVLLEVHAGAPVSGESAQVPPPSHCWHVCTTPVRRDAHVGHAKDSSPSAKPHEEVAVDIVGGSAGHAGDYCMHGADHC